MKKTDRIAAFVGTLNADPAGAHDVRYQGYFACFNARQYYEAHDVLEDLWLATDGPAHAFYKGLIQLAGAFVHLQKHHQHPEHPKHRRRLAPAGRLFALALANLEPFAPRYLDLDVTDTCTLCRRWRQALADAEPAQNPWSPAQAPELRLLA